MKTRNALIGLTILSGIVSALVGTITVKESGGYDTLSLAAMYLSGLISVVSFVSLMILLVIRAIKQPD